MLPIRSMVAGVFFMFNQCWSICEPACHVGLFVVSSCGEHRIINNKGELLA